VVIGHTGIWAHLQKDRLSGREIGRNVNWQFGRQAVGQPGRPTGRRADWQEVRLATGQTASRADWHRAELACFDFNLFSPISCSLFHVPLQLHKRLVLPDGILG